MGILVIARAVGLAVLVGGFVLGLPGGVVVAETAGPTPEIAAKIRAIGPVVDPAATMAIYGPLLAKQPTDGVVVTQNASYGPAERNVLDVYKPAHTSGPASVVIFFHGGGFVRGDKSARTNIGNFFARNGVLALVASYRLAPAAPWPAGGEDVVAALRWAQANVGALGGDPAKIVLMGESAGAAHVALGAFVARLHGGKPLGAAGVILQSGVYDVALENAARRQFGIPTPSPSLESYFGSDASKYPGMSTIRLIDAPKVPTLLVYADYDPAQMQFQAGEMFAALCEKAGSCPELLRSAGHGHISQVVSFNTDDTSVSAPILAFVKAR